MKLFSWFRTPKRIDTAKVGRHQKEIDSLSKRRQELKRQIKINEDNIQSLQNKKTIIKEQISKLLEDQYL